MSKKATIGVNKLIESRRVKLTGIETAALRQVAYRTEVNSLTTPSITIEDIAESINFERHSVMRAMTSLRHKGVLVYKYGRGYRARPYTVELEPTAHNSVSEKEPSIHSQKPELEPKLEPTAHELEPNPQQVGTDPGSEVVPNSIANSKNSREGASRTTPEEASEGRSVDDEEEGLDDPF